jgi:hypothetical protein
MEKNNIKLLRISPAEITTKKTSITVLNSWSIEYFTRW